MGKVKRLLSLAIALIIMSTIMFTLCRSSSAAEITYEVVPGVLTEAGYVNVYLNVNNTSEFDMTEISVTSEAGTLNIPSSISVPAGQKKQLLINNFYVSEQQIETGVVFLMTWYENAAFMSMPVYVKFDTPNTPPPTQDILPTTQPELTHGGSVDQELLTFSYSVNKKSVEEGGKVTLTYVVRNIHTEAVKGVTLTDAEIAGNAPIFSNVTIAAGDQYTKSYTYTMGETTVTSSPTLTYIGVLGNNRSIRGDSTTIERVTVSIDTTVTMGETEADGTDFKIKLTNNGNKPITGVSIKDERGDSVADSFNIDIAETKEVVYTASPDETRDVSFIISGKLATGEEYSYESSEYHVWKYVDKSQIGIDFDIKIIEPLDEEGYVSLEFTATNTGTLDMTELSITESSITTVIGTLATLAGGEHATATYTVYAGGARDLNFKLTAYAPNEQPFEYTTIISAKEISMVQQATPYRPNNPISVGSTVSSVLKRILTVLAILTAVSGVALIVLAVFEYESSKRQRNRRYAEKRKQKQNDGGDIQ